LLSVTKSAHQTYTLDSIFTIPLIWQ